LVERAQDWVWSSAASVAAEATRPRPLLDLEAVRKGVSPLVFLGKGSDPFPGSLLHAPASFLGLEIANFLWKKVRRAEITSADADLILGQLPALPLIRHPEPPLLISAFDLPDRTQRTVYDSPSSLGRVFLFAFRRG
jgi:hypothetical protein